MPHGAGPHAGSVLQALDASLDRLRPLLGDSGFEAEHISGIFNHSSRHIARAVDALAASRDTLLVLLDTLPFSAANLSSILTGAGPSVGTAIADLAERWMKIAEMLAVAEPRSLSGRLHGHARHLGREIDRLHESMQGEIAGSTVIDAAGEPIIAAAAPATGRDRPGKARA